MKEKLINRIIMDMGNCLDAQQKSALLNSLTNAFADVDVNEKETALQEKFADNGYYLEVFLAVKKLSGCQDTTLKRYYYEVTRFLERCKCSIPRCDTNLVRKYLYEYQKTTSNSTVDNVRRILNLFFQFLQDEKYIENNPVKKIPKIKECEKYVKFCNDYEVEQLRDSCITKRELALVDMLLSTGLRVHEVPKIQLSDIDWNSRLILIHGKGNKDRVVPFSVRAGKHMQEYVQDRKQKSQFLFCRTRYPYDTEPSKYMIAEIFRKIAFRAELKDVTIHGIRRWMACGMSDKGADISVIQDILGHAEFSTTKKYYLNKNVKKISQVHEKCSV